MSWTAIRPYFQTHLTAEGLSEWGDAFNFENIPSDILDGAYHIEISDFSGESQNQNDLDTLVRVVIRIFKKGYADPLMARDDAIQIMESVVRRVLKPQNRLSQSFKNIVFVSSLVRGYADSNDNKVVTEVSFDVRAVLDILN